MKKITKNNKGFSLIELIIVIAIMAVLVAIIAPNLTKYLGSSKKNTDKKNLDEIEATLKTCITDYEMQDKATELLPAGATTPITITWDGTKATGASGASTTVPTGGKSFKDIVDGAIDATKTTQKEDSQKHAKAEITKDATGLYVITMSWV